MSRYSALKTTERLLTLNSTNQGQRFIESSFLTNHFSKIKNPHCNVELAHIPFSYGMPFLSFILAKHCLALINIVFFGTGEMFQWITCLSHGVMT